MTVPPAATQPRIDPEQAYLALFERTIAVGNGKGGVGKTSLSTHLSANIAARLVKEDGALPENERRRVLLWDLDPQGNDEDDIGYEAVGDEGRSVVAAAQGHGQPLVMRDVRPQLDVIAGGRHLTELVDFMQARRMRSRDPQLPLREFAQMMAPIVEPYEWTLIDCPPSNSAILQDVALAQARYLLVPTRSDMASRRGMRDMAERFAEARQINPAIDLLAVVLFGLNPSATIIQAKVREWVSAALGDQAPLLAAFVRYNERMAFESRERGRLVHEMEAQAIAEGDTKFARACQGLAGDYQAITDEVLNLIARMEADA